MKKPRPSEQIEGDVLNPDRGVSLQMGDILTWLGKSRAQVQLILPLLLTLGGSCGKSPETPAEPPSGIQDCTYTRMEGLPGERLRPTIYTEKGVETDYLNQSQANQYVCKVGNSWRKDVKQTAEGSEGFTPQNWTDHLHWASEDAPRKFVRDLDKTPVSLLEVKYVILHSTIGNTEHVLANRNAHFLVDKTGRIHNLIPVKKAEDQARDGEPVVPTNERAAPHAGNSLWNGDKDLNQWSIGIEVEALDGEIWNDKQFAAVNELIDWLGGYYGLHKNSILSHGQVSTFADKDGNLINRGRKRDPYGPEDFWERLRLPDNSKLLDVDVAVGDLSVNEVGLRDVKAHLNDNYRDSSVGLEAGLSLRPKEDQNNKRDR